MVVNVIEASGGIAVATHRLDAKVEFARPKPLTALEHHVFKEMGHAAFGGGFKNAACAAPKVEAYQRRIGQKQADHSGAVGQKLIAGVSQAWQQGLGWGQGQGSDA